MQPAHWDALVSGTMPVLVLDFDGTVCVGDAPVLAYAEAVVDEYHRSSPDAAATDRFAADLRARLDAYLAGTAAGSTDAAMADGYFLIADAASGLTAEAKDRAYAASRRCLAEDDADVAAPEGLSVLLAELAGSVRRIVFTNAPAVGVDDTLARIGVADHLDGVITEAGKPTGWHELLAKLTAERAAAAVASVGDVWVNDLAAPLDAGAVTMLVDRFDLRPGPVNAAATEFALLLDDVRAWADDPAGYAADHPPRVLAATPPAP